MSNKDLLTRSIHHIKHPPRPPTPAGLAWSKVALSIMPIAQIAVGAVYLGECPRQHYIPIYLVVVGCFGLWLAVLSCLPCTQEPEDGTGSPLIRFCTTLNILILLFLFCWFITGNTWVYSIYEPNYNKTSTLNSRSLDEYCNKTLYLFAFWTITLVYILLFLLVSCYYCCADCCADCCAGCYCCCAFCRKAYVSSGHISLSTTAKEAAEEI